MQFMGLVRDDATEIASSDFTFLCGGGLGSFIRGLIPTDVRDASPTQVYSFLPASWAGDTHKETDVLPIGDREEMKRATTRPSLMQPASKPAGDRPE